MLVIGSENCNYGDNDNGDNCNNNTIVTNPPQSDTTGEEGNRIAPGVGFGNRDWRSGFYCVLIRHYSL
jgi:hypothetical protein